MHRQCNQSGGVIASLAFYWGKKYGSDKDVFFDNADIFVFPTYYPNECFPLVLLEAMQHGLPCISTNEGGIPDIIEDGKTGLLAEKQNAKYLADKMAWMIDHPTIRDGMGHTGWQHYKKDFTLFAFERRFANILEKTL